MKEILSWALAHPEQAGTFLGLAAYAAYQTYQAVAQGQAVRVLTEQGEQFEQFKNSMKAVKESAGGRLLKNLAFRAIDGYLKKRGWFGEREG